MQQQQQHAATRAHATPELSTAARPARLGMGNAGTLQQVSLLTDLQAWLDAQAALIAGMRGEGRDQRAYGAMSVVADVSRAFQQGETVDVSSLPMAPTAAQMPSLSGLLPAFYALIRPHLPRVASADGSATGALFSSTVAAGARDGDDASATATAPEEITSIEALTAEIMALRLKLPGESQTFPLRTYGDEESVGKILRHCVQCGIQSPDQVAYILATAWHESRLGKWMTESGWLSESSAERYAERKYGPEGDNPERARRNGNTEAGDGGRYMGRGYVQLTWKNNYERMSGVLIDEGYTYTQDGVTYGDGSHGTTEIDLVENYQHVNRNKDLAARILVLGMDGGHFVNNGRGLDEYIPEEGTATHDDFEDARRIVNGTDKKSLIADNAVTIQAVLRANNAWASTYDTAAGNRHGP